MRLETRFWRRLAVVFAAGFALRVAVAAFDARRPLFPPRYYQDEREYLDSAAKVNAHRAAGTRTFSLTPGKELYTHWVALLLRAFGPSAPRLANAAAGAGAAVLWGLACALAGGPAAGLAAAAFLAFWPSHAFHTAQAIKEAPIALLLSAGVAALCAGLDLDSPPRRATLLSGSAALLGLLLGFLRSYLLPLLAAAAVLTALIETAAAPPGRRLRAWGAAVALGVATLAYRPLKSALLGSLLGEARPASTAFVPSLGEDQSPTPVSLELTPAGITAYRRTLVAGTAESAIFPDAAFGSWSDLARFVPKACFYELFMPLPFLYRVDGKLGRALAALEGLVLLAVAAAAAVGLRRLPWTPAATFLCAFLLVTLPPVALLEFDLGSASRHRLHLIPCLLPFAAAVLLRRFRGRA